MRGLLIVISLLSSMSILAQTALESSASESKSGASELWQHMADHGLISQEQYSHVQQFGRLPGGTVVTNSPVAVEKQKDWNALAAEEVISVEELANVLFNGYMPRMTKQESKAFEELAPVYQPDRSKRIGYDIRRKHQKVEMIRMKHRMREKYETKYADAKTKAKQLGIPTRIDVPDGTIELQFFDDLGQPQFYQSDNTVSADSISTDEVYPTSTNGFSLTGNSITLGIWDDGAVRNTHQEFGSRASVQDDATLRAHHPSSVAGTMVAAGVHAPARGMAYEASIHSYDWSYDIAELASAADQLHVSNHSYGFTRGWVSNTTESIWYWYGNPTISEVEDYKFGLYDITAQERDQFVYDAIYSLPVWSAGNDRDDEPISQPINHIVWATGETNTTVRYADGFDNGFDTIGSGKTAKNILTVGAVDDVVGGYTTATNVVMSSFSGFGPTDDGRIKPDVVANGVGLITPAATGDAYYFLGNGMSGTSFSTPSVSGSLGLLQQLHEQLHGTNAPLWASTYKGIVIHTADEAGDHPGPDYRFGWGLMNTLSIARVFDETTEWNSKPYLKEVSLPDDEIASFYVMADTNQPLRVTICWTDVPGPVHPNQLDPTNSVLVNDLDLRVIDPGGITNFPWILDPFNPTNAATYGDNILDNVEQVVVENTSTGLYEIVINHKGSLSNNVQDVSILISGHHPENKNLLITEITTDSSGGPQLVWNSVVGSQHTIMSSSDLNNTNNWSEQSAPISIFKEETDWTDEASSGVSVRFYRINQTK